MPMCVSGRCAAMNLRLARPLRPAAALRPSAAWPRRRAAPVQRRAIRASAAPEASNNGAQLEGLKYDHILLAILDSNPVLSSASRTALVTAAALASQNSSKLTVMFVDEQGRKVSNQRLQLVQGELVSRGLEVSFVEEEVEAASVSKGSVAVGEVADNLDADLVVLSTAAVHEKHVDANLLAEFVPCPVLLLP